MANSRLRYKQPDLPQDWRAHPKMPPTLIHEWDLPVERAYAKILLFRHQYELRQWWKEGLGLPTLGPAHAAVNGLWSTVIHIPTNREYLEVDRRYFCVMGFVQKYLSMEVIAHESVHAAFCFATRRFRTPWDWRSRENEEETIAYPAGRIAAALNRQFHKYSLYP